MGDPIECERLDATSQIEIQRTTTGVAELRNHTTSVDFTNGTRFWAREPGGLVSWTDTSQDPPSDLHRVLPPTLAKPYQALATARGSALVPPPSFPLASDKHLQYTTVRNEGTVYDMSIATDRGYDPGDIFLRGTYLTEKFDRDEGPQTWCPNGEAYCTRVVPLPSGGTRVDLEAFSGLTVADAPASVIHLVCCNSRSWDVHWYIARTSMRYAMRVWGDAPFSAEGGDPEPSNVVGAQALAALAAQLVALQ
jgi:hypothetical protein